MSNWPVPGTSRTRATASLRRPVVSLTAVVTTYSSSPSAAVDAALFFAVVFFVVVVFFAVVFFALVFFAPVFFAAGFFAAGVPVAARFGGAVVFSAFGARAGA